jgi:diguanylate cyclase (GGDEF)-like protein/PAS domain S-box-containing protein
MNPTIALVENLPDAILLLDEAGAIGYANAAAERIFGRPVSDLYGHFLTDFLADPFADEYTKLIRRFGDGEQLSELGQRREIVGQTPDGSGVAIELSLTELKIGDIRSLAVVGQDIRDRKQEDARRPESDDRDSLTGLVDRIGFEHALTRHIEYASRYGSAGSVIALGIDSFKYVNESLGVAAGDEMLSDLAGLIRNRMRKTDVCARVGGDVFAVLVHGADRAKAMSVADELLGIVRRHSFVIDGEGIRVTMSAGVTFLDERKIVGAELLAEAETAMSTAKDTGRDRVVAHEPKGRDETDERRAWTERVRQATERGLFVLTSQPILDLSSDQTTQHEVLLRMREDGGGGLVAPGEFLETAERFGLIGDIDRWVTQQAVRLIASHGAEGRELTLEVNLSGNTMGDARFLDEVKKEITSSGIDPARLIFEITETAAVADIEQARLFAQRLAKIGCGVALDDFGAGYASFFYLKNLPIDYLKIDGEFIKELPNSRTDQLIVKALVDVCTGLGIKTVAEFVGDEQTLAMVRELGVDFAQGYHLGKPEPVSALRELPN